MQSPHSTRKEVAPSSEMTPMRAAIAAMVGSVLEYYDFFVYGPLAALVFSQIFFSADLPKGVGTLLSLITFGIGFVARPLGGVVIGHFGDRIGRKSMLMLTFMITGFATILIGAMPTYHQIGWWAPMLLVTLRFIQGFGIGGEWGGAALLAVETAPEEKKAFYGSLVQAGAPIGVILSSGAVATLTATLTTDQIIAWGWRIPFLVSVLLVIFGLVIRSRIEETPQFAAAQAKLAAQQRAQRSRELPLAQALKRYPGRIFAMTGVHTSDTTLGLINGTFVIGFASNVLGMNPTWVLLANMLSSVCNFAATIAMGKLVDRVGSRRPLLIALTLLALWAFPAFWLIETKSYPALFIVMGIGGMIVGALFSPQASLFADALPPQVRYSGMSLGFQLGTVLGGGLGPIIAQWLSLKNHGHTTYVSLYVIAVALVAMGCTWYLTRSHPQGGKRA